jgi:hypothetical protein
VGKFMYDSDVMNVRLRGATPSVLLLVVLAGCDDPGTRTITHSRTAAHASAAVKPGATMADRFESAMADHESGGGSQAAPHEHRRPIAWTLPAGWVEKPDTERMRVGSFLPAGNPQADCSIVLLPGQAGGVENNVNRWRHQLGASELEVADMMKLPAVTLLGTQGILVEVAGTYAGMGDSAPKPDYALMGAISQFKAGNTPVMIFVKMVGPKALVDAERQNFLSLCDSIRIAREADQAQQDDPQPGTPQGGGQGGQPETGDAPLQWTAPLEWKPLPEKPMRKVSFGAASQTECYITVFPGEAGGVTQNMNRWRNQMGLPPLDDAGVAALPRADFLGQKVALFEAKGTFENHPDWLMLALIGGHGDNSVFLKMIGPESEVVPERERFLAFARSVR